MTEKLNKMGKRDVMPPKTDLMATIVSVINSSLVVE